MTNIFKPFLISLFVSLLTGCGAYYNQPLTTQEARISENTAQTKELVDLPVPLAPIVVGVYNFKDQTGQYKATDGASSTFSTAVTQGATSILIKALQDSKWFRPIERESLGNLLNERNIIRTTRDEYRKNTEKGFQKLTPLLFAGILLEGGIISYDTNIITGGAGARYFGVGGSTQYRQDRITIYLRAVSTSTGEVLKTVNVSKTILSQAVDINLFRYVHFQRLLEVETGFTKNEPAQMAVQEAIEKAVKDLIVEGIKDDLWKVKFQEEEEVLVKAYDLEKEQAELTQLYDRFYVERRGKNVFGFAFGTTLINGDLPKAQSEFMGKAGYKRYVNPYLNIGLSYSKFNLKNKDLLNEGFMSLDLNAEYNMLPYDNLSPFFYAGFGINASNYLKDVDPKIQYGLGVEYLVSPVLGINIFAENNIVFSDKIDKLVNGKRDDFYYRFGVGLNIYLAKPKTVKTKISTVVKKEKREKKQLKKNNSVAKKRQERISRRLRKQERKKRRRNN